MSILYVVSIDILNYLPGFVFLAETSCLSSPRSGEEEAPKNGIAELTGQLIKPDLNWP